MKTEIKAIETVYNGYRFRSRLEARWAVFFDTLGIKYEYEKEGYDLGEAGWYLPDFYFPERKMFVEIKAGDPGVDELKKVSELACQHKTTAWLFCGLPSIHEEDFVEMRMITAYGYDFYPYPEDVIESALNDPDEYGGWEKVERIFETGGAAFSIGGGQSCHLLIGSEQNRASSNWALFPSIKYGTWLKASLIARQARFEHGEKPTLTAL